MFTPSAAWHDRFAEKDYPQEARRVAALIRQHQPGARMLLDVACGTGRHLEHLRHQFVCEGLDLNQELLEVARQRLPGIRLTHADMADFDLGRRFDAVICLSGSVGYLGTVERLQTAVATMARHLEPGGVLVVEAWLLPEAWSQAATTRVNVVEEDDQKLVRVIAGSRQDALSVLRMHYVVATAGEIVTADERHELRLFTQDEYLGAFAAAGLQTTWDPKGLTGRGLLIGAAAIR